MWVVGTAAPLTNVVLQKNKKGLKVKMKWIAPIVCYLAAIVALYGTTEVESVAARKQSLSSGGYKTV